MYENNARAREYDSPKLVYGFFGGAGFVSLVLCLLLASLIGCGKGSPTTPPPPPNPDDYEPLGTTHVLKYVDGTDSNMWIRLLAINPPRGSRVEAQQQILFTIQTGVTGKDAESRIDLAWSVDGRSENEPSRSVGAPFDGQNPATFQIGHWVTSAITLKYIIAKGNSQPGNKPPKWATTNFLIDYR